MQSKAVRTLQMYVWNEQGHLSEQNKLWYGNFLFAT
jgi:hypothetical protein